MDCLHNAIGAPHPVAIAATCGTTVALCSTFPVGGGWLLAGAVVGFILKSRLASGPRAVGTRAERLASHCIKLWDEDVDDEEEQASGSAPLVRVKLVVRGREKEYSAGATKEQLLKSAVARRAADYARVKVGLPKDNEANRLVVRRLVQEYFDSIKDMRLSHRKVLEPIAVMLVFTPTDTDVLVADMEGSAAVGRRREEYYAEREAYAGPWWTAIPGLGGFRRRYVRRAPGA